MALRAAGSSCTSRHAPLTQMTHAFCVKQAGGLFDRVTTQAGGLLFDASKTRPAMLSVWRDQLHDGLACWLAGSPECRSEPTIAPTTVLAYASASGPATGKLLAIKVVT